MRYFAENVFDTKEIIIGAVLGGIIGLGVIKIRHLNEIPHQSYIQSPYIAPSKIEIICEDLDKSDGKGLPETYLKVDGKRYALHYADGTNTPTLSSYTLEPSRVVLEK